MITYDLSNVEGPVYKHIYESIKKDILEGKLSVGTKMPSKRNFAKNLGVSTITIENAYDQLIGEGYMYALEKRGYYISDIIELKRVKLVQPAKLNIKLPNEKQDSLVEFSSNRTDAKKFPFSIWAKLLRENISYQEKMLTVSPCCGVKELRQAIAEHLASFRGMQVDPDQIIVGAGTEYMYNILIKLFGLDKRICVENPGYAKITQVYESNGIKCNYANVDDKGLIVEELRKTKSDIAHISPTHHFPTGITMPVSRRYELLAWANEKEGRYIIEDDYDSEFRLKGKPLPTLMSIDASGKVIYMNTFSKSITSTIRVSYMVLPEVLANLFYEKLSFYSCTVSTFEQYTLARFIGEGYFEKHINRMRLYYGKKRKKVLDIIRSTFNEEQCKVIENDSGLHFILQFFTKYSDKEVKDMLLKRGIAIKAVTDFYVGTKVTDKHEFILDYSSIDVDELENVIGLVKDCII